MNLIHNDKKDQPQRRLVVFIGPPKTASTSLQDFLAKYVSHTGTDTLQVDAFRNWKYPLFLGGKAGLGELRHGENHPSTNKIRKTFQNQPDHYNLVVGTEYFTAYSSILGGQLFDVLTNWTGIVPEIVIHARSPRTAHLMSIWRQQTQQKGKPAYGYSMKEYICDTREEIEKLFKRRIGAFTNPLALAYDIITKYQLQTYVMDIGGVAEQGLDISHAFSCSILQVNCTSDKKWVQGLEGQIVHDNSGHGYSEITLEETWLMEQAFQQRDCAFYDALHNESLFQLLYPHSDFWAGTCRDVNPNYRRNVSSIVERFRSILQCPGSQNDSKEHNEAIFEHILDSTLLENSVPEVIAKSPLNSTLLPTFRVSTSKLIPNELSVEYAAYSVLILLAATSALRLYARKHRSTTTAAS